MPGRKAGTRVRFQCANCQGVELVAGGSRGFVCSACRAQGIRWVHVRPQLACGTGKEEARAAVAYAVKTGALPHPSSRRCVDCDGPAVEYEHRDYNQPLAVEPVCRGCNLRRGPALPVMKYLRASVMAGCAPYTLRSSAIRMLRVMGVPTDAAEAMPTKLKATHWRDLLSVIDATRPDWHPEGRPLVDVAAEAKAAANH